MLYIGTSGFSFKDWIGAVYPEGIRENQMLKYYWGVLGFNAVELNFTYYRMPSYKTIVSLLRRTPNSFMFSVKLPSFLTHGMWKERFESKTIEEYLKATTPLKEEGKLLFHLAQFPYAFKYSKDNLEYIARLKEHIDELAVEFRHISWDRDEVYEFLKENEITFTIVDEPKLQGLFPYRALVTTDKAYFRFHGRNKRWFEVQRDERYDYFYTDEELLSFAGDVNQLSKKVKITAVFFNNCHKGSAALNALKLRKILNV
ncbi:MAG: DUF72 domain-containing protein [Thermotogaceae bacterium]|nr:DUF72 domain-containing protein [Thermotogaceae bacterium]